MKLGWNALKLNNKQNSEIEAEPKQEEVQKSDFNFDFDFGSFEKDFNFDFDMGSFEQDFNFDATSFDQDFKIDFDMGSFEQDFKIEMPDFSSFEFDMGSMPGFDFDADKSKLAKDVEKQAKEDEKIIARGRRALQRKERQIKIRETISEIGWINKAQLEQRQAAKDARHRQRLVSKELRNLKFEARKIAIKESGAIPVKAAKMIYNHASYGYYTWAVVWDQLDEEKRLRKLDKETYKRNREVFR